ncbi:MAG TPA: hypothetical protein VGM24_09475 [Puia sp.]
MEKRKNYNTISPSARSILLLKGCTNIPFAREVAGLLTHPGPFLPAGENRDFSFWARVVHFENRYWSIDQLLEGNETKNILELSSGYSFRGLDRVARNPVHYIDTDLEDVISLKRKFISVLEKKLPSINGSLEILPLNALDEMQFKEIVRRFEDGPLVIVNEGLLMYLDLEEKKKLCALIHQELKARGGIWITADIYIRRPPSGAVIEQSEAEKYFYGQHRIEENKFESFEAAESFFKNAGLKKLKTARPDHGKLSTLPHLIGTASAEQEKKLQAAGKIQETWMLEAE